MPTWKKVVVSGSNISQLNNDATYLTAGTLPTSVYAFTTMSWGGQSLIADQLADTITIISQSGTGLVITGTPGDDTVTMSLSSVPNSSLQFSSVTIGSTAISLGGTQTTLAGLTSVTSTNFVGTASYVTGSIFTGTNQATSASYALTASYAANAPVMQNLTQGAGIAAFTYNGGSTATVAVSGAADLNANTVVKWNANDNAFTNSLITDNGTLVTVGGNLRVTGTASFEETTNLLVADRFILLASGSTGTGEGGLVVQQATQGVGELFGWDNDTSRWAVTSSFTATGTSFVPDAFVSLAISSSTVANPNTTSPAARYNKSGNIFAASDETIWIWS